MAELDKIKPGVTYNIVVNTPVGGPPLYTISYQGEVPPPPPMYEEPPIEPIPASFPPAYQNSNNSDIPTGRKCGNCKFFEAESGNCSRWNAIARDYYWCAVWDAMEPVIAQPNAFTDFISEANNPDDELYNFFSTVIDPLSAEPNLSNFLTPFDALHSV